ncbi:MAG: hypothetical protein Q4P29_02990 [Tissierellia bacterium]|nr:hypothetical protein [Tissierellia bacterium]
MNYKKLVIIFIILVAVLSACGFITAKNADRDASQMLYEISKLDNIESTSKKISNLDGAVKLSLSIEIDDKSKFYETISQIRDITTKDGFYELVTEIKTDDISFIIKDTKYENSDIDLSDELLLELTDSVNLTYENFEGHYKITFLNNSLDEIYIELLENDFDNFFEQSIFNKSISENTSNYIIRNEVLNIVTSESFENFSNIFKNFEYEKMKDLNILYIRLVPAILDIPSLNFTIEKNLKEADFEAIANYAKTFIDEDRDMNISFSYNTFDFISYRWLSDLKKFETVEILYPDDFSKELLLFNKYF